MYRISSIALLLAGCLSVAGCNETMSGGNSATNHDAGPQDMTVARATAMASKPRLPTDTQALAVIVQLEKLNGQPIENLTPSEARRQPTVADAVKALLKSEDKSTTPEQVAKTKNISIPGPEGSIDARIYTPAGGGPFPVVVYYHGGGFVLADIDTYDASARALANAASAIVVSCDYRRAPENHFPAAPDDALAAYKWVLGNIVNYNGDAKRVAVAGESAGGNLATVVCLEARDKGIAMPVYQLLVYPVTDWTDHNPPSYQANMNSQPLNTSMMHWFARYYFASPNDANSPYASPIKANLTGLPDATVITAEIDPLHDDGKAYADKLIASGVKVSYRNYKGVPHEFFGMGAVVDQSKEAVRFAAEGLDSAFKMTH